MQVPVFSTAEGVSSNIGGMAEELSPYIDNDILMTYLISQNITTFWASIS